MTDTGTLDETDEVGRALTVPMSLAVGIARAEIDQQITTARAYPRSLKQVTDRIFSLATLDKESAEESMYALPRGGKPITGPSIRFAEVVKQAYGNCRAAARVVHVDRDEKFVEAEGIFHDLETNVATTARVRRRIVDSKGKLYSDDMIIVTGNAACSIALRNAIMGGVPKPLWRRAYEAVQLTIKGDITTLSENRTAAVKAFATYGVSPEQVFAALGVNGGEDITVEHIPVLRGMFGTLRNGEATVEEMFGSLTAPGTAPQPLHAGFSDQRPKSATRKAKAEPERGAPTAQEGAGAGADTKAATPEPDRATAAAADALGNDSIPAEGGARPTETASAQAADAGQDSLASATDASGASAEETSSPPAPDAPSSGGEKQPADDVISEGYPEPDEVYHLNGDEWDLATGRRETYKNGMPFSSATRKPGHKIYEDHRPEGRAEPEPEEDDDNLPPEFSAYIAQIEAAKTWVEVKTAMQAFYNTATFKGMTPEQQNKIRGTTWETCVENNVGGLPDQAQDVSAFRLWIEAQDDPDAIDGTLQVLEQEQAFAAKADDFKNLIRAAAKARITALLA